MLHLRAVLALGLASFVAAGCLGAEEPGPSRIEQEPAPRPGPDFREPIRVGGSGQGGHEPSIEVGAQGWVFVTAPQAGSNEGDRLGSHLWYSIDGGETWTEPQSPAESHTMTPAGEGEIAVDATGRLYFIDMGTGYYDVSLTRWRAEDDALVWEDTRPVLPTASPDDRPWLVANGDGTLYYLANAAVDVPAPNNAVEDPGKGSRMWFYRSLDRGLTWTTGHGFPDTGWCNVAAPRAANPSVLVVCSEPSVIRELVADFTGETLVFRMVVYESIDRGDTWTRTDLGPRNGTLRAAGVGHPVAFVAEDGSRHAVWVEADEADQGTRIKYSLKDGDDWKVVDVTPENGTYSRAWVSAIDRGSPRISFYLTPDAPPTETTEWRVYAVMDPLNASDRGLALLDPEVAGTGVEAPRDFFQNAIDPEGRLHVSYERVPGHVIYVQQAGGGGA